MPVLRPFHLFHGLLRCLVRSVIVNLISCRYSIQPNKPLPYTLLNVNLSTYIRPIVFANSITPLHPSDFVPLANLAEPFISTKLSSLLETYPKPTTPSPQPPQPITLLVYTTSAVGIMLASQMPWECGAKMLWCAAASFSSALAFCTSFFCESASRPRSCFPFFFSWVLGFACGFPSALCPSRGLLGHVSILCLEGPEKADMSIKPTNAQLLFPKHSSTRASSTFLPFWCCFRFQLKADVGDVAVNYSLTLPFSCSHSPGSPASNLIEAKREVASRPASDLLFCASLLRYSCPFFLVLAMEAVRSQP